MNLFFHPKMLPEIFLMAMSNMKAREEIAEINRLAKERGIRPKYITYMTHYYAWKNNPKRKNLYRKKCKVISRGRMNSVLVEFETGQREIVSRNAIRKIKEAHEHNIS